MVITKNIKISIIISIPLFLLGVILISQRFHIEEEKLKSQEIKPIEEVAGEDIFQVFVEDLKEGINKIGNIAVTKIVPQTIKEISLGENVCLGEVDNNLTIKTFSTRYGGQYEIFYKNKKIDEGDYLFEGNKIQISIFSYQNSQYIDVISYTGGSGGLWRVHDLYILNKEKNNKLRRVRHLYNDTPFSFSENNGYVIISYKDFLYIVSSQSGSVGAGACQASTSIFSLQHDREIEEKHFYAGCYGSFMVTIYPEIFLVEKDNKFYIKVRNGYFYVLDDFSGSDLKNFRLPQYWAGVDEYYLIKEGKLIRANTDFKKQYLQTAEKYNRILKEGLDKAGNITIHQAEELSIGKGWPSLLLGKVLNLIFAGEKELAWKEFNEDFVELSAKYPLDIKVDPTKLRQEIQKDMSERRN